MNTREQGERDQPEFKWNSRCTVLKKYPPTRKKLIKQPNSARHPQVPHNHPKDPVISHIIMLNISNISILIFPIHPITKLTINIPKTPKL